MYCNGMPERNIGFLSYVHKILGMLDRESLAMEPIKLNLNIDRGREMKKKEREAEVPKEAQSRSLLHHKVGVCPQCDRDMCVVSTKKAFGKPNQACECEHCGYVENR